ncbi:MAG TPA: ABC transporter substrate-binding protein [Chloroflexota bacterium]|jgi:putative ABC transport system substrate-binding protein
MTLASYRLTRRRLVQGAGVAGLGLLVDRCGTLLPPARPPRIPRVGFLGGGRAGVISPGRAAFAEGMRDFGHIEDQAYVVEYRGTDGHDERAPELAADLVQLKVDVIYTSGTAQALAAKQATRDVPIVAVATGDLVALGLVESLAHPGGNVTGVVTMAPQLSGKRLELLRDATPELSRVGLLADPVSLDRGLEVPEVRAAARTLGLALEIAAVDRPDEAESAVASLARAGVDGLLVTESQPQGPGRRQIVELVAQHRLPAIYPLREFVDAGGLMSYGPNFITDAHRRAASHVDRILKGAKPADLPVEQPTTFEFVINLRTAQVLGLSIPQHVLLQATEIIQ